jgi:hypothetical protein
MAELTNIALHLEDKGICEESHKRSAELAHLAANAQPAEQQPSLPTQPEPERRICEEADRAVAQAAPQAPQTDDAAARLAAALRDLAATPRPRPWMSPASWH